MYLLSYLYDNIMNKIIFICFFHQLGEVLYESRTTYHWNIDEAKKIYVRKFTFI